MKLVFLTPGTGSYHCGVCMRDNALAKELIRMGHEAIMLPMYLPLTLDESAANTDTPVFFGGINVYLQQKFPIFRRTPRWLDRLFDSQGLLRWVGKFSGMTGGSELGELTHSMLLGEDGHQAKEVENLIQWLRSEKPDAVWLSTALLVGLARQIRTELGIPVFCSLQGEDSFLDSLEEPWRKQCWKTLAERSADVECFVAPSRYFGELMSTRLRLKQEQLRVLRNGITLDGFGTSEAPEQPPTIGYLARLHGGKGLGLVVDAFIELKRRGHFPNVRLQCVGTTTAGDDKYIAEQKRKLADAGIAGDAEFRMNVSREEKISFLKKLTLLSVPAIYGEAFGLYLLEAWAAGIPVVQPRHAAFPELLEATGGGVLFEPGNPRALADAWETLLADPERAREFGQRGRAAVEQEFSLMRMAERFLELTKDGMGHAKISATPVRREEACSQRL
ncbi:glycosyltransferase family 4 protein [Verrucomicrobiota bacterium sgz303538]